MTARKVLVTGASRGIGAAVAEAFAERGDHVIAVARSRDALRRLTGERTGGGRIDSAPCDVTDEHAVDELFERHNDAQILVNNAGTGASAPIASTTLALWEGMLQANARSAFLCTRAAVPAMLRADWGRIVMVASTAGLRGEPYTSAYGASKHAMVGLARAVAAETVSTGVTVNAVCPSFVDTSLTAETVRRIEEVTGRSHDEALGALVASTPTGRLLSTAEVVSVIMFLCSDEAAAVNGQAVAIGGPI